MAIRSNVAGVPARSWEARHPGTVEWFTFDWWSEEGDASGRLGGFVSVSFQPRTVWYWAGLTGDGRPFVLMEAVDGLRIEETSKREKPEEIAASAVGVLKRLHTLPLEQSGIGDEEPMPLVAEMMRWAMLMQRAPEELTARAGELGGMLAAGVPAEGTPTLVHGDYHYGNMLFRGPEVVAVLDWEIAQIGQPLMDLGCLAIMSHRSQFKDAESPGGTVALPDEDLFALYGAGGDEMNWYVAMSLYKYAAILGYNLMLHRRGKRPDPFYETLTTTITGMIDEGIEILR